MIDKFGILVIAVVLLAPPAAQAQAENDTDFTIEYGFAGSATSATPGLGTYFSVSGANGRIEPYMALNGLGDAPWFLLAEEGTILGQAGANIRLGPPTWLLRPVARVGVGLLTRGETTNFTGITGGAGLYWRERDRLRRLISIGVSFTADFWSTEGTNYVLAHAGFFFRFG